MRSVVFTEVLVNACRYIAAVWTNPKNQAAEISPELAQKALKA